MNTARPGIVPGLAALLALGGRVRRSLARNEPAPLAWLIADEEVPWHLTREIVAHPTVPLLQCF